MTALSLKIEQLEAGYGQTKVIENVSFTVDKGSRLAILGRNGVGKTTLFGRHRCDALFDLGKSYGRSWICPADA